MILYFDPSELVKRHVAQSVSAQVDARLEHVFESYQGDMRSVFTA